MRRVLILDDDNDRHDRFRAMLKGADVVSVHSATECIRILNSSPPFDLVCLDRDLDLVFKDHEETGEEVAEYIRLHLAREKYPRQVLIHSWNTPAAKWMAEALAETGIPIVVRPFGLGLQTMLAP